MAHQITAHSQFEQRWMNIPLIASKRNNAPGYCFYYCRRCACCRKITNRTKMESNRTQFNRTAKKIVCALCTHHSAYFNGLLETEDKRASTTWTAHVQCTLYTLCKQTLAVRRIARFWYFLLVFAAIDLSRKKNK